MSKDNTFTTCSPAMIVFPAIFIKSGVWLAKRDIRTPRSPHRFHGAWELNVGVVVRGLQGMTKRDDRCGNVATFSVLFLGRWVQFSMQSHFSDGFFVVERSFFPWFTYSQIGHGYSTPEAKAAKSEKKKADKEGVLKGWAWELKMPLASPAWRFVWYMDNFDVKKGKN